MSSLAGLGRYHLFAALHHCNCAALHCNAGQGTRAHSLAHSSPLWPDTRNATFHVPLKYQKIENGFLAVS